MKKIAPFLLTISTFMLLTGSVAAQPVIEPVENGDVPAPVRDRPPVRDRESMPDVQEPEQAEKRVQDAQQLREDALNQVAQIHARRIQRRFDFYSQRLNTIADKLQNRLQALEAEGQNVSESQEQLETALQRVELGMTQAREATDQLNEINPEQYQDQREIALEASDLVQEARTNFMQAVELMKEAVQTAITTTLGTAE